MLRQISLSAVIATAIGTASPGIADVPDVQVMIEVRFVTVSDKFLRDVGVDFGTEFGAGDTGAAPGLLDRRVSTTVTVSDGGTAAIGGLFTSETRQKGAGIPALRNLPVLGRLFRAPPGQPDSRDLIILITPHLVGDEEGGGGTSTASVEAQDVGATTESTGASAPGTGEGGSVSEFFDRLFQPPCTHPTKPCETHRRADAPGNFPNGAGDRDSADRDHEPE